MIRHIWRVGVIYTVIMCIIFYFGGYMEYTAINIKDSGY